MHQRYATRLVITVFACATSLANHSPYAQASNFVPLSDPDSGVNYSEAIAVSANGNVVVGQASTTGLSRAFVWDASKGFEMIENTSVAFGVSGDGQIVVGQSEMPAAGWSEPFRWTRSEGLQLLGSPAPDLLDSFTFATGASFDGAVIVGATKVTPNYKAFRWTARDAFQLLSAPGPPYDDDSASAVSDDGETVVGYDSKRGEAFRWTPLTGKVLLGSLWPGATSGAINVSPDGTVVVGQVAGATSFRWTEATGMIPLEAPSPPGPNSIAPLYSYASATTRSGEAIVGSGNGTIAYVWTEAFGMESLSLVLARRFGLGAALSGWQLEEARDITPDGRTIVGKGRSPSGKIQAWLVRLDRPIFAPEPAGERLLSAAAIIAGGRFRRRRRG